MVNPDERDLVVGHGDYKPDNLLYTQDSGGVYTCHPIDWVYAHIRPRWCDIGFLAECYESSATDRFYFEAYRDAVGADTPIRREEDARAAYLQGRVWASLRNAGEAPDGKCDALRSFQELGRIRDELVSARSGSPATQFGPATHAAATAIARRVVKLQSGYLYHYAFLMLAGVAVIITWYLILG